MRRFLGILILLLLPAGAHAAEVSGIGPRIGFSTGPDQLALGGQLEVGEIAPDLDFTPNVELGFGDHTTLIAFNLDLHYKFRVQNSNWSPYLGAGVGVNFLEFDRPAGLADDSETEVGGNFIIGAQVPTQAGRKFFSELKLGLGDIPDLKLLVGWNFKL
jgi:hypothetical protein